MNMQIEFSFEAPFNTPAKAVKHRRIQRARWWFDRMRQVVDRALDRRPEAAARPEQRYLFVGRC
jgi:hypothetical protein